MLKPVLGIMLAIASASAMAYMPDGAVACQLSTISGNNQVTGQGIGYVYTNGSQFTVYNQTNEAVAVSPPLAKNANGLVIGYDWSATTYLKGTGVAANMYVVTFKDGSSILLKCKG